MSAEEASRIAQAVQRMKRSKRALQIALPTAAALGAGAAVAVGSIPGSDGTIAGCYAGASGATIAWPNATGTLETKTEPPGSLRVIDPSLPHTFTISGVFAGPPPGPLPNPAAVCKENEETQITWNQKGPTGPQGPPGTSGTNGSPGGQGPAGESGGGETTFGLENKTGLTFLKLDGIGGAATDKRHKGDIEIDSFSFGLTNAGAHGSGGGGGAGKVSLSSFKILKPLDKSSPLLLNACATGKHIKFAELVFARKAGGTQMDYLYLKLDDVLVSSVQAGGSSKGTPEEQVTFNFLKMQETFVNGDGKPGATVNFNLSANAKI
jgi:type VI secretion system secreted protein Hcp